jgi:histidinol-phosphate aminotransferase
METFLARIPDWVLVVLDEAYFEYADGPGYFQSLSHLRAGRENLVVLRSFSKVYGLAGLRVGYMLAHEAVIDYMERARPPFNVNRLAQVAALAALGDKEHVQRSIEANEAAKQFFYNELRAMGVPYVLTYTNFMAIDVGREATQVSGALLERGFVTTALDAWGVPNHVRFSFGTVEENEAFVGALREVLEL